MVPAFEMAITHQTQIVYFLGEVVREQEVGTVFRHQTKKWTELMNTNTWRKYYGQDGDMAPVLLTMTTDDVTALKVSRLLHESGELQQFRITTEERTKQFLHEKGAFLKYIPEHRQLREIRIRNFESDQI